MTRATSWKLLLFLLGQRKYKQPSGIEIHFTIRPQHSRSGLSRPKKIKKRKRFIAGPSLSV